MNGIPNLLNQVAAVTNTISLLSSDVAGILGLFSPPQWGIYFEGEPFIIPDSLLDFSFQKESKVSTYPQEKGSFESYNKVQSPYQIKVHLTKGGTDTDRKDFLESIDTTQKSFDLYQIMTPDTTYENVTITHYNHRRTSKNGVSLLTVEIWAEEIMDTATVAFTKAKNETSNDPVNGGTVQPQAVGEYKGPVPVAR